jgi:hypothetical protein
MKTKNLILQLVLCSFVFLQNIEAQSVFVKGTGALLSADRYLFDGAVEWRFKKQLGVQLSLTKTSWAGESSLNTRDFWTAQLRYYFLKNPLFESPFCGIVLQQHDEFRFSSDLDGSNPSTNILKNYGVGLMTGLHVEITKRFGVDFHIGCLGETGNQTKTKTINNKTSVSKEKSKFEIRRMLGLNFYLAIGEIHSTTKKITKNTEGSL